MSTTSYQLLHLASMFCHKIRAGVFVKNFLRPCFFFDSLALPIILSSKV